MKYTHTIEAVLLFVAGLNVATSCSDSDTPQKPLPVTDISTPYTPLPTDDNVTETYSDKTVVLGDVADDNFGVCLNKRLANVATNVVADAKTFVFGKNSAEKLSVDDVEALIKAYTNNANFVIINPQTRNDQQLFANINQAIERLEEQGVNTDEAYSFITQLKGLQIDNLPSINNRTESVAFRKKAVYVVRNLDEMADSADASVQLSQITDDGTLTTIAYPSIATEPTERELGISAEMLVRWLKSNNSDESELKAYKPAATRGSVQETLEDLMNAQKVTIQYTVGPTNIFGRTMFTETHCFIYAVHKFDTNEDYYFVRLNPHFHASNLGCNHDTETDWKTIDRDVVSVKGTMLKKGEALYYGPYLKQTIISASLQSEGNDDEISLYDARPTTGLEGSHSYTSGWNASVSGNLGFNMAGPIGGIAGTIGTSESYTHAENDLKIKQTDYKDMFGYTTQWTLAGIDPEFKCSFWMGRPQHEKIANFQVSDWSSDLTWIYVVKNPKVGHSYKMVIANTPQIAEMYCDYHNYLLFAKARYGEFRIMPSIINQILLNQPNRVKDDYVMLCSNEALLNNVRKQIGDDWKNDFTYYAPTESEVDEGAVRMFNRVKTVIAGLSDVLYQQGYTDTYYFNLRKKGSATNIASFTIKDGKVQP